MGALSSFSIALRSAGYCWSDLCMKLVFGYTLDEFEALGLDGEACLLLLTLLIDLFLLSEYSVAL